jgi:hypothetical protein
MIFALSYTGEPEKANNAGCQASFIIAAYLDNHHVE